MWMEQALQPDGYLFGCCGDRVESMIPSKFLALPLYARCTLDCLIEMGWAVSADFITRPQLYVSDDIPDAIVKLRMKYGSDPDFPNTTQRHAMLLPILSKSDGLK